MSTNVDPMSSIFNIVYLLTFQTLQGIANVRNVARQQPQQNSAADQGKCYQTISWAHSLNGLNVIHQIYYQQLCNNFATEQQAKQ